MAMRKKTPAGRPEKDMLVLPPGTVCVMLPVGKLLPASTREYAKSKNIYKEEKTRDEPLLLMDINGALPLNCILIVASELCGHEGAILVVLMEKTKDTS